MDKVFITNSNLSKFVSTAKKTFNKPINRNELKQYIVSSFSGEAIEDILDIFTSPELVSLYFYQYGLKESDNFLRQIINNKNSLSNYMLARNHFLVYQASNPSYHLICNCKRLLSSYYNIKLPEGFQSKAIRQWVIDKIEDSIDFEIINLEFKKVFHTDEDLEEIKAPNSGTERIENDTLTNNIEQIFIQKKQQLRFLLNDSASDFIKKHKYISFSAIKNIENNKTKNERDLDLIEYFHAKEAMNKILKKLVQNKYNPELAFDKTLLNNLGFKQCKSCYS